MAKHKLNIITALAIIGLLASLWFLYQARAGRRARDEQLQRLRQRMAQLEDDVARLTSTGPFGLTAEDREAYLPLEYKEFDATPGSGFCRFRDQPQNPARAGTLIEEYLERHPELSFEQRTTLTFHAAQLFAIGGMNERAITHLDRAQLPSRKANLVADATKAFLLLDREGLLATRRRMADGDAAKVVDLLIERFGESYADLMRIPVCSTVSVPADASPNHRATADELAKAFGLSVTVAGNAMEGGIPGNCIWLEVRPMGGSAGCRGVHHPSRGQEHRDHRYQRTSPRCWGEAVHRVIPRTQRQASSATRFGDELRAGSMILTLGPGWNLKRGE